MKNISIDHRFYKIFIIIALVVLLGSMIPSSGAQATSIRHVIPGGMTTGGCGSWGTACDLQYALSISGTGDEIWVKMGTYNPTKTGDRHGTFQLQNGIGVYGGFDGTEITRDDRNWLSNVTILSGDINRLHDNSDNSYNVVTGSGTDSTAILDGFTITGGNAIGGVGHENGGGMFNNAGSPTLTNIIFDGNHAYYSGGGLYNLSSTSILTNVTFTNNTVGYFGGGMYNSESSIKATNLSFYDNASSGFGGGVFNYYSSLDLSGGILENNTAPGGGGMYNANVSMTEVAASIENINMILEVEANIPSIVGDIHLDNTTFMSNTAEVYGGGMYNNTINSTLDAVDFILNSSGSDGGGIYNDTSDSILNNVTFDHNSSGGNGGGMFNGYSNPILNDVLFEQNSAALRGGGMVDTNSSPVLTNVTFKNNSSDYHGGGMNNRENSNAILINVIFDGNTAVYKGGALHNYLSSPSLTNVVFVHNSSSSGQGGAIHNENSSPTMVNVTMVANTASAGAGGVYNLISDQIVHNSIIWGNPNGQIVDGTDSATTVTYSDIQGGCPVTATCSHLISIYPEFIDEAGGDFRLLDDSPAIDAGDNDAVPAGVLEDLDGHPRFMDIPTVVDTGNGTPPIVDMGAYERSVLMLTDITLQQATNTSGPWTAVDGSYTDGFSMLLDPAVAFYYLDADTIDVNNTLKNGDYPFYITSYPPGFFEYWASRGVTSSAVEDWQKKMWEIINGNLPIFYLKVTDTDYILEDGLQYTPGGSDYPLRIDGAYLVGDYSFGGVVQDTGDNPEQVSVKITFYNEPEVYDQAVTTQKNNPVDIVLASKNLYPPMLTWTIETAPAHGTLSGDAPNLIYTPNLNYTGADQFTFSGNNGYADSNVGTVLITVLPPAYGTTTSVNCGSGSPIVTYGSNITCVATVTRITSSYTPTGSVSWTTSGAGSFTTSPCTLSGSGGTATCSVTYTPIAVGTGSHLITATYNGSPDFTGSSGNQSVTVNKANASCEVIPYNVPFDGTAHTALGTCTGIGDVPLAGLDLSGTTHTNAGSYPSDPWTFTDAAGNYNSTSGTVSDVITKVNPSCSVTPYNATYDGNPHTATGTCTGVGGATLTGLVLSGTTHTNAGSYPSDPWTFTDTTGNYNNASGTVSDVIAKANANCTVIPYNVPYDGNPHTATGSCKGVGDVVLAGLNLTGTTHTNVGIYASDPWTFTDVTGNYNSTSGTIIDTIIGVLIYLPIILR